MTGRPVTGRRRRRLAAGLALGWGTALLLRPDQVAAALAGRPTPPASLVRVLGARQVLQELAVLAAPHPVVRRAAAGVDGLHGLSMLLAAVVWPRYRRAELLSAAVAVVSAAAHRIG